VNVPSPHANVFSSGKEEHIVFVVQMQGTTNESLKVKK